MYKEIVRKKRQGGQALIELILAIAIAGVLLAGIVTTMISVREAFASSGQSLEANLLLQKEVEAVRSIKEGNWNSISSPGTYHSLQSGSGWIAANGTALSGIYTYSFSTTNICRLQTNTQPVSCVSPGATVDPSTKQVTATVSWTALSTRTVSTVFYITRYSNNSVWTQTTQADFNLGTNLGTQVVNNAGGEVELSSLTSFSDYGNKFLVTATSAIGTMTRILGKTSLRFTAQNTKVVSAVRVYVNTRSGTAPTYRLGIQTNNPVNNLPSGTWIGGQGTLTNPAAGWRTSSNLNPAATLTAGQIYHLVVESTGGGAATGSISLRRSTPLNALYPQTQAADLMANTLFTTAATFSSASIQNFQPIYGLDFTDSTYEGNPFESNTEISVFGNNWFGERFSFTGANKTAPSVSFYIRRNGTPPNNLNVQIRRVSDNGVVYTGTLATPTLPTTYAFVTHTFSPTPLTLTAGTAYRVIIQTSGGSNANSYRFRRLNTTNSANYNSITYDGINSVYTNSPSAGATGSWVDTNNWDFGGFKFTIQTTGLGTSGTFESQTFDALATVGFNYLFFNTAKPIGSNLRIQVATNSDGTSWNYLGPDGSSATYFDLSGAVNLSQVSGRYFRFKAYLTGNGVVTPTLFDTSLNYSK